MVDLGQRNANYVNTIITFLENKEWGLQKQFQHRDVRELRTKDFADFLDKLAKDRPDLSDSTRNMMTATFRNVLKVAVRDGVIDAVPATPRVGGGAWLSSEWSRISGIGKCDDAISKQLVSPSSYKRIDYTHWKDSEGEDSFFIDYDADNSFGAALRGKAHCTIKAGKIEANL